MYIQHGILTLKNKLKHPILTPKQASGFSLVELLLVIAIISILVGFGSVMLRSPRPVEAAQLVSGVVEAARVEALRNGIRTRVAINFDPTHEDYLRQVITLIDTDQDPETDDWTITLKRPLPQGIIYLEEFSGPFTVVTQEEMKIDPDKLSIQNGTEGGLFLYHEFDGLGRSDSSSQWVFSRGEIEGETVSVINDKDRDGFIIRKTGKTTFFSQPSQITQPSTSP